MLSPAQRPATRSPHRRLTACLAAVLGVFLGLPATKSARAQTSQPFQPYAETAKSAVLQGREGWLFLSSEIHFLSAPEFWGAAASSVSKATNPDWADPLPAILDFQAQLKARGIHLLVVPVPPKAALYPEQLPALEESTPPPGQVSSLTSFYKILEKEGVQVLDLVPILLENRNSRHGPAFCTTDSHWSGNACVLAAQAISQKIAALLPASLRNPFSAEWKSASFRGDLLDLPGAPSGATQPETLPVRRILHESSGAVSPDPDGPLLLIGDSHTLVFHDFLSENSGLLDQLAFETALAPDLIGTRGSGATPVRISLLRRSVKDPGFLSKKKVVVWCFSAREFTESESGWQKVAISK
jgi:hypothetical protein